MFIKTIWYAMPFSYNPFSILLFHWTWSSLNCLRSTLLLFQSLCKITLIFFIIPYYDFYLLFWNITLISYWHFRITSSARTCKKSKLKLFLEYSFSVPFTIRGINRFVLLWVKLDFFFIINLHLGRYFNIRWF